MKKEKNITNSLIQLELIFSLEEQSPSSTEEISQDEIVHTLPSPSKIISLIDGVKRIEKNKEEEIVEYILLHAKRF